MKVGVGVLGLTSLGGVVEYNTSPSKGNTFAIKRALVRRSSRNPLGSKMTITGSESKGQLARRACPRRIWSGSQSFRKNRIPCRPSSELVDIRLPVLASTKPRVSAFREIRLIAGDRCVSIGPDALNGRTNNSVKPMRTTRIVMGLETQKDLIRRRWVLMIPQMNKLG